MTEKNTTQLYEYWMQEFKKIDKEYDLAVKERRVTRWMKDNAERINGLMKLRFTIGMNTFYQSQKQRNRY